MTQPVAQDTSLLIVDDDERLAQRLAQAMEKRGFAVELAFNVADGLAAVERQAPAYAVIDLRLQDGSGLDVVKRLHERRSDARTLVLTGYGNIATAVAAVKLGAVDYLPKPVDADRILAALTGHDPAVPSAPNLPMTADRVRWEHIQRVYEECGRNVSETARRLRMHRRTLQRILAKYAPQA